MAKPNPTLVAYESIMADLRKGVFKPIYYLVGKEAYFIDKICNYITNNALTEEERDFNQVIFYGADTSMRQVLEQARRFPMMAERQVVVLREAQAADEFALIEKYCEKLVPTTVLVICSSADKSDGRKKYTKQIATQGVLFDSIPLREYEVPAYAEKLIHDLGATIDKKACAMIAEHVGSNLKRLMSEAEKVLVTLPSGAPKNITPQLVEKCIGISNEFNGFELRDSLVHKDVLKANIIINHLSNDPRSGGLFKILPNTFSFFQNLMLAYYAPAPRDESAIMSYLGLANQWAAKPYIEAMKHYSATKTLHIINKFREIDCKSKGLDNRSTPPEELAQELFHFILH